MAEVLPMSAANYVCESIEGFTEKDIKEMRIAEGCEIVITLAPPKDAAKFVGESTESF